MKSPRIRLCSVGPQIKQAAWESSHRLRIGRMPDLEVRVKDPSISRIHAEVTLGRDGWVVRDLGSMNGTFVNGVRVGDGEHRLHKCDLLQCGNIVMLVNLLEEPASEPRTSPNRVTTHKPWEEAVDYFARQLWLQIANPQATIQGQGPTLAGSRAQMERSSWEKAVEFSSLETTRRKAQRITSYLG